MKIMDKKIRCVMLIASIVIGLIAALSSYISLKFPIPASVFIAAMICIPAVWQMFFMPVYLRAKHYFFIGLVVLEGNEILDSVFQHGKNSFRCVALRLSGEL